MPSVEYITPITNRTRDDVYYAKENQADLVNKNKGAWNYTDLNRICNNLKYAAEYMLEKGFLSSPYSMQLKLDWKETDIVTIEQLNNMILNNINNLKTYSRPDLQWYNISSLINIDYNIANWLELDIHALATQEPLEPATYKLTIVNGNGSGDYPANTIIDIQANPAEEGTIFERWIGEHLENIGSGTSAITTYKMPHQDITLTAVYTSAVTSKLTVITHTKTDVINLTAGHTHAIEADPAPLGKVFHRWEVEPEQYKKNLYEPAATTTFSMPNEDVTLTAIYKTTTTKTLKVINGTGSGDYDYEELVSISPSIPSDATFTSWSGDTEYLVDATTVANNQIKMPDKRYTEIRCNYSTPPAPPTPPTPPTPPVENVPLIVKRGIIISTGETEGVFTEGDKIQIRANDPEDGYVFTRWDIEGDGELSGRYAVAPTVTIGKKETTVTANYRQLVYHNLIVTTHSGTTKSVKEQEESFSVDANPAPEGQVFEMWTGDNYSYGNSRFEVYEPKTGTYMGTSDRTIEAKYREIKSHKLTVHLRSGDVEYTQDEFTQITISADNPNEGERFVRWSKSGVGSISSDYSQNITFTFGNGDCELTPVYVNIWTITVINGTIGRGYTSKELDEGSSYDLQCRGLAVYEKFDGWELEGKGKINNIASTKTTFTVGKGDATITANISQYPDKTLTIYMQDPETLEETFVSQQSYTYGTNLTITAPTAPNRTTFLTWLGDVDILPSGATASTTTAVITKDARLVATYFYPENEEIYILNITNGTPETGEYAAGTKIPIKANEPQEGWEFQTWYGDTAFLIDPDLTLPENYVRMPRQSINLYARYKIIGELSLYSVNVIEGTASASYEDESGKIQEVNGVSILIPAGTQVKLTPDKDLITGYVFAYWDGNFETAGVQDLIVNEDDHTATFTMPACDMNIQMRRRELAKCYVYGTNATSYNNVLPGIYQIQGTLINTDEKHYEFLNWTCKDVDGNDRLDVIENPNENPTNITLQEDDDFWIEAIYKTYYKLIVANGQDTGTGYYYEGEVINTVTADTPEDKKLIFDHWDDPTGIIKNIYDPTPEIVMKDSVAIITAVYVTTDQKGNSVVITGDDLHSGLITRHNTSLISGIFAEGTIVFDKDGCIGVITKVNPDLDDNTDDYEVTKLFYGGNF